jgi:hypothetical protein
MLYWKNTFDPASSGKKCALSHWMLLRTTPWTSDWLSEWTELGPKRLLPSPTYPSLPPSQCRTPNHSPSGGSGSEATNGHWNSDCCTSLEIDSVFSRFSLSVWKLVQNNRKYSKTISILTFLFYFIYSNYKSIHRNI